ncbi:MAG: hypothetical protein H7249_20495 [Chitinophagaceae bacterium]|nr:hypothetical protein [Oligoflexus sp.]
MKPNFGLTVSLGLLVVLSGACNGSSSKKASDGPSPTPSSASAPANPGVHSGNAGNSGAGLGATPTGEGAPAPSTDGSSSPPAGSVGSSVRGIWGTGLAQKPRSCSTFYDLRDTKSAAIHILCPGDFGKLVSLQTDQFSIVSDDGTKITLQKTASTCVPLASTQVVLNYTVTPQPTAVLVLSDANGKSPELRNIDGAALAGDLTTGATLNSRPVVRGCFTGGQLAKFAAQATGAAL